MAAGKKNRTPFDQWKYRVHTLLIHPDAINCVVGDVDATLRAWHEAGCPAYRIAWHLTERYSTGFLERKARMTNGNAN